MSRRFEHHSPFACPICTRLCIWSCAHFHPHTWTATHFPPRSRLHPYACRRCRLQRSPAHSPCGHICPHLCTKRPCIHVRATHEHLPCRYPCPHCRPELAPPLLHSPFYPLPSGLAHVVECIVECCI
jgi:hypothetical protein